MRNTIVLISFLAAALALAPDPVVRAAQAEADPDTAKSHADRGMMYYNLSDWPSAIREFRDAFKADPRPEYLFSKAQAERQRGDYAAAILSYKAFLRTGDHSPARIAATEGLMAECQDKLEEGRRAEAQRQREERKRREERAPEVVRIDPPREPSASAHRSWATDPAGLVLFISAVGVGATGTAFFFWGSSEMRNSTKQATYRQYESDVEAAKTKRILGIVGMAVGAGLLATSIVRFALVASRSPKDQAINASLVLSPTGIGVDGQF